MRRLLLCITSIVMVGVLAACSNNSDEPSTTKGTLASTKAQATTRVMLMTSTEKPTEATSLTILTESVYLSANPDLILETEDVIDENTVRKVFRQYKDLLLVTLECSSKNPKYISAFSVTVKGGKETLDGKTFGKYAAGLYPEKDGSTVRNFIIQNYGKEAKLTVGNFTYEYKVVDGDIIYSASKNK